MSDAPSEIHAIIARFRDHAARTAEARALVEAALALAPKVYVLNRGLDELTGDLLGEERAAAHAIATLAREVLGPAGMPLPRETFADLMPEEIARRERWGSRRTSVAEGDACTPFDLEALWPAMMGRFATQDDAHAVARADVAARFVDTFFGRREAAGTPESYQDGIKLNLYACHESYSASPTYSYESANRLVSALDLIASILNEAGLSLQTGVAKQWADVRPYAPHQRLDLGLVKVLCRKERFELILNRNAARAVNLFLAAHTAAGGERRSA